MEGGINIGVAGVHTWRGDHGGVAGVDTWRGGGGPWREGLI